MSTNDMAQDRKIVPVGKVELKDILSEDKIATLDLEVDEVNVSDERKFTKLELTQGQRMQMSGLMNQLPALLNVASLPKTVRLTFPRGVQGSLMVLKRGGYSSAIVDNTGKIVGTASLDFPTFQTATLGVFTVMSIASGQYFLAQINNKLSEISSKLDKILEFLHSEKRAELLAEVSFIQFAHENYRSVMEHSEQRIATLVSLQNAKKVAMKDIEFYLSDLKSLAESKSLADLSTAVNKKKKGTGIADKIMRTQEGLALSLQLYTTSNLLEVYYSENFDSNYIDSVKKEALKYVRTCEKHSLYYFGQLEKILAGAKTTDQQNALNMVKDFVAGMDEKNASPLETELQSTLDEASKEKQYYLTPDGEVYLLKAS